MLTRQRVLVYGCDDDIRSDLIHQLNQEGFVADIAENEQDVRYSLNRQHYDAITVCTRRGDAPPVEWLDDPVSGHREPLPVFMIPSESIEGRQADAPPPPLTMGDGSRPRILHVEDNPVMAGMVASTLRDCARIINAKSLAQAHDCLQQSDFDLVILDMTLPDGSGLDLLHDLQHEHAGLPVVIHATWEITDRADNLRAVLNKSYTTPDTLRLTVERVLH